MPSMPWIKLYTEMLDDVKLADLTRHDKWLFVQLILLAGECDREGAIPMSIKQISWRLRETEDYLLTGMAQLKEAGIIEIMDNGLFILAFRKRQDRPQKIKQQQWNDAQRRHREKSSSVIDDSSMTNTDVIPVDKIREDKIREEEDKESAAAEVFKKFESEINLLTPQLADTVGGWIDDYSPAWVIDAITEAVNHNARKPAYIAKILSSWKANGRNSKKPVKAEIPTEAY